MYYLIGQSIPAPLSGSYIFIFKIIIIIFLYATACRVLLPRPGSNPYPWHWKHSLFQWITKKVSISYISLSSSELSVYHMDKSGMLLANDPFTLSTNMTMYTDQNCISRYVVQLLISPSRGLHSLRSGLNSHLASWESICGQSF